MNPLLVEEQLLGGPAQGLGGALLEELVYDADGQLITTTFMDYLLPMAMDVPASTTLRVLEESPSPLNPLGVEVNGQAYERSVEARRTMADFLREELGLTGTHVGCEHGACGACTVVMDGAPVLACLLFTVQAHEAELLTVEGLADRDRLHPLRQAFWEHHGLQCGFCTPGFLMTRYCFLRGHPTPTDRELREAVAGNLGRCTGSVNIIRAAGAAAERLASGSRVEGREGMR